MNKLVERPILIAGIGGAAWWVLQGFTRNNLPVEGFVVSRPIFETSDTCCGLPVYKAQNWNSLPRKQDNYVIVLGVMNPKIDVEQMKSEFIENGWREIFSFAEYASKLLEEEKINCSMIEVSDGPAIGTHIQTIRGLLADYKSLKVFNHFLNFCTTFVEDESIIDETPYFVPDLPKWNSPLKLVDCGAFDGDTVREALNNGYAVAYCICCEPDQQNYSRLVSNLVSVPNAIALPFAVGDKFEAMSFDEKGNTGSRLTKGTQGQVISCITLDHLLPGGKPNLIKMDIEGYEYEALLGAQKLLLESRPGLAISVYHLSNDILRIPLFLNSLFGDSYTYFLRRHSRTVADTILYAFPKENS